MPTATRANPVVVEVTSPWLARVAAAPPDSGALHLTRAIDCSSPSSAQQRSCAAVFSGLLHNRRELAAAFNVDHRRIEDAELILHAYERWGRDCPVHIRGVFAFVIRDAAREIAFGARDRVGVHPMFWARAGRDLLVASSINALLTDPNVSREFNRPAMVDHLRHTWGDHPTETFYAAVSRIPAGHAFEASGGDVRIWPYWSLLRRGEEVDWLKESDIEQFDEMLDMAVKRCLDLGRSGLFLSGGLDSVSIAAAAVELARQHTCETPVALSLAFSHAECNEEQVQRGVAAQLGLAQALLPFDRTVEPDGMLWSGLMLGREMQAPLNNGWAPAYYQLRLEARRRGCEVIMTGNGGDDWLTVNPLYVADLLRTGNIAGIVAMSRTHLRSYVRPPLSMLRRLIWGYGLRPLATMYVNRWLKRLAPGVLRAHRRRRQEAITAPWLSPDPQLRQESRRRFDEIGELLMNRPEPQGAHGFFNYDGPGYLVTPVHAMEFEEAFELSRRTGAFELAPYWDADLVEFLNRVPPELLDRGGRAKGLVRDAVARRFPGLGFGAQRKVSALNYFGSVLAKEGPEAWNRLGGAPALTKLGVVGPELEAAVAAHFGRQKDLQFQGIVDMHRIVDVMHLEAWVRSHAA